MGASGATPVSGEVSSGATCFLLMTSGTTTVSGVAASATRVSSVMASVATLFLEWWRLCDPLFLGGGASGATPVSGAVASGATLFSGFRCDPFFWL